MTIKQITYCTLALILASVVELHPQGVDPTVYYIKLKEAQDVLYSQKGSVFRLESAHPFFSVINAANQKVLQTQSRGQSRIIFVGTGEQYNTAEGNPEDNLYDTSFLNLDSPEIKKAAANIYKGGSVIFNVENFVKNTIHKPTYGIPLLPARDVLLTGTGDCTEHAVLSVALLRSMGIAARAVVGMVLVREYEAKQNIFVFHMWAEAFQGGKWRLVDATSPGDKHLNRYIAFTYHNLRTESPLAYIKAVGAIQDLTVTYVKM